MDNQFQLRLIEVLKRQYPNYSELKLLAIIKRFEAKYLQERRELLRHQLDYACFYDLWYHTNPQKNFDNFLNNIKKSGLIWALEQLQKINRRIVYPEGFSNPEEFCKAYNLSVGMFKQYCTKHPEKTAMEAKAYLEAKEKYNKYEKQKRKISKAIRNLELDMNLFEEFLRLNPNLKDEEILQLYCDYVSPKIDLKNVLPNQLGVKSTPVKSELLYLFKMLKVQKKEMDRSSTFAITKPFPNRIIPGKEKKVRQYFLLNGMSPDFNFMKMCQQKQFHLPYLYQLTSIYGFQEACRVYEELLQFESHYYEVYRKIMRIIFSVLGHIPNKVYSINECFSRVFKRRIGFTKRSEHFLTYSKEEFEKYVIIQKMEQVVEPWIEKNQLDSIFQKGFVNSHFQEILKMYHEESDLNCFYEKVNLFLHAQLSTMLRPIGLENNLIIRGLIEKQIDENCNKENDIYSKKLYNDHEFQ